MTDLLAMMDHLQRQAADQVAFYPLSALRQALDRAALAASGRPLLIPPHPPRTGHAIEVRPAVNLIAALAAVTAQLADLAAWRLATQHGAIEGNPLMGGLAVPELVAAKLAGAALLGLLAWRLAPRRIAYLPALIGIVGAASGILAAI